MTFLDLSAVVLGALAVGYLLVALIAPEKF